MDHFTEVDEMFRQFQIDKFSTKFITPFVKMDIDVDIDTLAQKRHKINQKLHEQHEGKGKISFNHIILYALTRVLPHYPMLYGNFIRNKYIPSAHLNLNIPVDVDHHVEYIVIFEAETKSFSTMVEEYATELEKIKLGAGNARDRVVRISKLPRFLRRWGTNNAKIRLKTVQTTYGNFPVTNVGRFNISTGFPTLSEPIIAVMGIGKIRDQPVPDPEKGFKFVKSLPIVLCFDHRPIDAGYGGRFLNDLKNYLEHPSFLDEFGN